MIKFEAFERDFLYLLSRLIGHVSHLQNRGPRNPSHENLVVREILDYLRPALRPSGSLIAKLYGKKSKKHLVIETSTKSNKHITFMGMHMDVVQVLSPESWTHDPFRLTRIGDKLFGRGVSDCLGHCALIAVLLRHWASANWFKHSGGSVAAVFLCNEEAGIPDSKDKTRRFLEKLPFLKSGPIYWLDSGSRSIHLTVGGLQTWELTVKNTRTRRRRRSGGPSSDCVNPNSIIMETFNCLQNILQVIPKRFPPSRSTMIATSVHSNTDTDVYLSPSECTVQGELRVDVNDAIADIHKQVEHEIEKMEERNSESVRFMWTSDFFQGTRFSTKSWGHRLLVDAWEHVFQEPPKLIDDVAFVPMVSWLKNDLHADVQMTGFGEIQTHHCANEFGRLSEFMLGARVINRLLSSINQN